MQVPTLYDTISFIPCKCESFTIEGCEDIPLESNTIYKTYKALNEATGDLDLLEFFYNHKVVVTKRIPSQAGLGGGSSDAAAFMRLAAKSCNLLISTDKMAEIASGIGADIPFFIYNYSSANVSGFGEIVEPFDEEPLELEIFTPDIACDTAKVYQNFKQNFLDNIDLASFAGWQYIKSKELLKNIADPILLNDLYPAALLTCPELKKKSPGKEWFFSGSGSSFFRPIVV